MASFIRDVWAENVDAEFVTIREAIVNYPYVAMVSCCPPHLANASSAAKPSRVALRGTPLTRPPDFSVRRTQSSQG